MWMIGGIDEWLHVTVNLGTVVPSHYVTSHCDIGKIPSSALVSYPTVSPGAHNRVDSPTIQS